MPVSIRNGRVFSFLIALFSASSLLISFPGSTARAEPPAPTIIEPTEITEYRGADSLEVRWELPPGAETTHLVLARDRAFRRIVYENANLPGTFFLLENLNFGPYFLKVAAVSYTGERSPFSKTRSIIITPPPPKTITGTLP